MEPGEKESFEKSLQLDPELNASYQEYIGIFEAIGEIDTLDLRTKLKEIKEEKVRRRRGPYFLSQGNNWMWMAALITVIISFTAIITLVIKQVESKEQIARELGLTEKQDLSALDRELIRFEQRNMDFKIESPRDSIFLNRKNPLLFKWTVNSMDPLILELIDWQGQIIYTSGKPVESPFIINKKLPGGILVYRFRTETEAYYLGFLYLR